MVWKSAPLDGKRGRSACPLPSGGGAEVKTSVAASAPSFGPGEAPGSGGGAASPDTRPSQNTAGERGSMFVGAVVLFVTYSALPVAVHARVAGDTTVPVLAGRQAGVGSTQGGSAPASGRVLLRSDRFTPVVVAGLGAGALDVPVDAGLADGMYVQVVTTDPQPGPGGVTATRINKLTPRTVFPEKARVDLEGLVTTAPSSSGSTPSFAIEGKPVRTDNITQFPVGTTGADIRLDMRIQVQGAEIGGVLFAGKVIFR